MNISYNWLKDYVSFDVEPDKLSHILTFTGLEVEDFKQTEEIPGGLQGVVVGEVVECKPHPNSDHLHVTQVNIGTEENLQIVCGAPNVAEGQKVFLATIGCKLGVGTDDEFTIKKSKLRGVESFGMICAEDELGIGTDHEGIMVLKADAIPGTPAKEYLKLSSDSLLSIDLTPNRVDGASFIGVARDLSAYLKLNNAGGDMHIPQVNDFDNGVVDATKNDTDGAISLEVKDSTVVPRYMGVTLSNIKIGPSPEWMQKKLRSVGLRPINNVVDIANFVLQEVGQPLHTFDADKIKGNKVIVKLSKEGDKLVTLDGIERTLSSNDLVICDGEETPMCLAGVLGGLESGVSETTTSVFLESAYFHPVYIRKTSKHHTLKTEASFRYERGGDPSIIPYAAKRAVDLLIEYAGAKVVGKVQEFYPKEIERKQISINYKRIENFIGQRIGVDVIKNILTYLEFEFISSDDEGAVISVPTYRVDVERECDVVEEILRIYGYNNVNFPDKVRISINNTPSPDPEIVKTKACDLLASNGFMECMSNSLTKSAYYSNLTTYPEKNCVKIINPLSSELNVMRQTLLFNGLEAVEYNLKRRVNNMKFFEMGHVYSFNGGENRLDYSAYNEEPHLLMLITGKGSKYWRNDNPEANYFELKGYVELLFKRFGISLDSLKRENTPSDIYSDGIKYLNGKHTLVSIGKVKNTILDSMDIHQAVFAAEISWDLLLKIYSKEEVLFTEMPKFPEVKRDLALLIDDKVSYADLKNTAFGAEKKLLKQVKLFDVFTDSNKLPEGKKQYALSFILQDTEKTLTDKVVDKIMNKIMGAYKYKFGATLR